MFSVLTEYYGGNNGAIERYSIRVAGPTIVATSTPLPANACTVEAKDTTRDLRWTAPVTTPAWMMPSLQAEVDSVTASQGLHPHNLSYI